MNKILLQKKSIRKTKSIGKLLRDAPKPKGLITLVKLLGNLTSPQRSEHDIKLPENSSKVRLEANPSEREELELARRLKENKYEPCRRLIDSITDGVMQQIVVADDSNTDVFAGQKKPLISLNDYLYRLVRYLDTWFGNEPSTRSAGMRCLMMSLIYLQRLQKNAPEMCLHPYNVHRVFLVAMLAAAKFTEDKPIGNAYWARVGGVDVDHLNELESHFCSITEFDLYVQDEEIEVLYDEFIAL